MRGQVGWGQSGSILGDEWRSRTTGNNSDLEQSDRPCWKGVKQHINAIHTIAVADAPPHGCPIPTHSTSKEKGIFGCLSV